MQYICLIYTNETDEAATSPEEQQQVMEAYNAFTKDVRDSGAYVAGEALHPTKTATTVRVRNGKTVTTDGPFAETKEQLGGYYVVNAKDLDEAIMIAAKIPSAKYGSIEVRPLVDFTQM
jgi:hypothetical protein